MLAGAALGQDLGPLIDDLVLVVVGFVLSRAIMRTLLRPLDARMRLLDLSDPAASVLDLGATALLGLLAGDQLLATWFIREDVSPELLATEQVVFCLLIALPLWGLLMGREGAPVGAERASPRDSSGDPFRLCRCGAAFGDAWRLDPGARLFRRGDDWDWGAGGGGVHVAPGTPGSRASRVHGADR